MSIDLVNHYYNRVGTFPANNQQWWLARQEIDDDTLGLKAGDFVPELLAKFFMGDMRAPRGHYVLNAFSKNRSFVSGVSGLDTESVDHRPPTVAFFSGRAWFACDSTVYYSQIMTDKYKAGLCFQEADPTAEHISDLVASDGGHIPIPEAVKIVRILPYSSGMLVFAKNGVWFITGNDQGFTALDISVRKLSPIGCPFPKTIVQTTDSVFWWSNLGIMGLTVTKDGADVQNISENTIQSFYNDITDISRREAKGVFDFKSNTIQWLYRSGTVEPTQYNFSLTLDLDLTAFVPWKFTTIDGPRIKGAYASNRANTYTIPTDIPPSFIEYIVIHANNVRFAQTRNGGFVDWGEATYNSYVESGYEIFDDAMRKKAITYLFTYLTRTETEATGDEVDYPSSCKMQIRWDWANGSSSNKWTPEVEVYKPRPPFGTADTGFAMVVTKSKVRGNGKAIQFRYGTNEAGKNFELNGWSVAVSGNTVP